MDDSVSQIASNVYNTSITHVNMALAVATALAWNEAVRQYIREKMPQSAATGNRFRYAILLTVITAVVFTITQKYLNPDIQQGSLNWVVS
jgi:hypothetical protein